MFSSTNPEIEAKYRQALKASLAIGYRVLMEGGNAMDAAVAAATFMEGSPLSFWFSRDTKWSD